jgi:hypothetical protein
MREDFRGHRPLLPSLNNLYFFLSQSIQLINKIINLLVNGVDLAREDGLFVNGFISILTSNSPAGQVKCFIEPVAII